MDNRTILKCTFGNKSKKWWKVTSFSRRAKNGVWKV